jgi:hypothetical protein
MQIRVSAGPVRGGSKVGFQITSRLVISLFCVAGLAALWVLCHPREGAGDRGLESARSDVASLVAGGILKHGDIASRILVDPSYRARWDSGCVSDLVAVVKRDIASEHVDEIGAGFWLQACVALSPGPGELIELVTLPALWLKGPSVRGYAALVAARAGGWRRDVGEWRRLLDVFRQCRPGREPGDALACVLLYCATDDRVLASEVVKAVSGSDATKWELIRAAAGFSCHVPDHVIDEMGDPWRRLALTVGVAGMPEGRGDSGTLLRGIVEMLEQRRQGVLWDESDVQRILRVAADYVLTDDSDGVAAAIVASVISDVHSVRNGRNPFVAVGALEDVCMGLKGTIRI